MFDAFLSSLPSRHWRELGRLFRNHHYEYNDEGDLIINRLIIRGRYQIITPDGLGVTRERNLVTTQGMNYLLAAGVGAGAQVANWYIAPIGVNVAVANGWTYSTSMGNGFAREDLVQYASANRPAYDESVPTAGITDNTANPARIITSAANQTLYGVCVVSNSTKNDKASGILLSASLYATPRVLPEVGEACDLKYTLSLINDGT